MNLQELKEITQFAEEIFMIGLYAMTFVFYIYVIVILIVGIIHGLKVMKNDLKNGDVEKSTADELEE